jgi:hypothetical protein
MACFTNIACTNPPFGAVSFRSLPSKACKIRADKWRIQMPAYKHDCDNPECCRFLVTVSDGVSDIDVYLYKRPGTPFPGYGLLLRNSSEGSDYETISIAKLRYYGAAYEQLRATLDSQSSSNP